MRSLLFVLVGILAGCASTGAETSPEADDATSTAPSVAAEVSDAVGSTADAESSLARARRLVDEAEPFAKSGADTSLPPGLRVESRRKAYDRLKEARALYDDWLDAHPDQAESLDAEYVRVASMLFWVKKTAGKNELG